MSDNEVHRAWWADVAVILADIAEKAGEHLPAKYDAPPVNGHVAEEIQNRLQEALLAADSATAAYARVQREAQVRVAPEQLSAPASVTRPPHDGAWARGRSTTRGW